MKIFANRYFWIFISGAIHLLVFGLLGFDLLKDSKNAEIFISIQYQEGKKENQTEERKTTALPSKRSAVAASLTRAEEKSQGQGDQVGETLSGDQLGISVQYPRMSRKMGEVGEVRIDLRKNPAGEVENISVGKSSGFQRLDQAALMAMNSLVAREKIQSFWKDRSQLQVTFIFKLSDKQAKDSL